MNDKEFTHVLNEIKDFDSNTTAKICLYLMQDPLTDPKIIERTAQVFEYFPNCSYELSTNAMLLTPELSKRLVEVIKKYNKVKQTEIWLSHFAINEETYKTLMRKNNYKETLQNIIDYLKINNGTLNTKIIGLGASRDGILFYFSQKQFVDHFSNIIKENNITTKNISIGYYTFHNRAGNVRLGHWDGTEFHRSLIGFNCWRYDTGLHILFDLSVISCCMNYKKEMEWGNLKEQSLKKIWNGKERKRFIEKAEGLIPSDYNFICKLCSSPGG